jgi:hypothetical protein
VDGIREKVEKVMSVVAAEGVRKPNELRKIHPFEIRLKARTLYLQGMSLTKISEELKINKRTILNWSTDGHWKDVREKIHRHLERKELKRLAEEAALELRNSGKLLNKAQDILETQFYRPETNEKGEPIPNAFVLRGRGDWKLDDTDVMRFLLALTDRRETHLKTTLDFLGEYFPKVSPSRLKLPVAGRDEEVERERAVAAKAQEAPKKEPEEKK